MKKLITIEEFKKLNSKSQLEKNEMKMLNAGQGTWQHERYHTNKNSGYGYSSDHSDWYNGDGSNHGHTKGSLTFLDNGGCHQVSIVNT